MYTHTYVCSKYKCYRMAVDIAHDLVVSATNSTPKPHCSVHDTIILLYSYGLFTLFIMIFPGKKNFLSLLSLFPSFLPRQNPNFLSRVTHSA